MTMTRNFLIGLLSLLAVTVRADGEPTRADDLAAPVRLSAMGKPIDVPGFAAPYFGDIDGDGKKELLVGQLDFGRMRIYDNVGPLDDPTFGDHRWFETEGRVACVPTGCAVGFTPQVVDFDADGRPDILTGSFIEAATFVFRANRDGTFRADVIANREGSTVLTPRRYNSTVFATDWDGDGDLDLIVGRSAPHLVMNEGDRGNPAFGEASKLLVNGLPLPSGRIPPCVADWDGDGRNDLIIGRRSDIVWYRNSGESGMKKFDSPQVLVSEAGLGAYTDDGPDELRRTPSTMPYAVCVTDFDADGKMDLLVGDHYYLRRPATPEKTDAYREMSGRRNDFRSNYRKLVKESPTRSAAERGEEFRDALRQWGDLQGDYFDGPQYASHSMERHGGVWLYRRTDMP